MRDELEAIDGVGEATAEKIMDVIQNAENPYVPDEYKERVENTDEPNEWLERAYSALEEGDETRALTYLKRSQ